MSADSGEPVSTDTVLQAFRLIDDQIARRSPAAAHLSSLRRRLVGELVGDVTLVAPELADGFEVQSFTGGNRTTINRAAVLGAVERQGRDGTVLWVEFDQLVADGAGVAGQGVLRTAQPVESGFSLVTVPVALFISFDGDSMTSESLYMEPAGAQVRVSPAGSIPSYEQLLEAVGASPTERMR